MNIVGKGYHHWTLEFEATIKNIMGTLPPRAMLKQSADDLKEEWFRGTAPQEAAHDFLRRILRTRARGAGR